MCHSGFQIFGGGVLGGAQADLLAVPAADFQLLKMPEGISTEQALLLTDNLATGWAAAQRADIPFGGTVAVDRPGRGRPVRAAQRAFPRCGNGFRRGYGRRPAWSERRDGARCRSRRQPLEAILAATGGRGADAVIDAVATDASLTDAINAVRPGGTVSVVGVHDMNPFPLNALGCLIRSTQLADDHRAGAAHLAGVDPAAAVRPARRRRHLHHDAAVGRSREGLRDRRVAVGRRS